GPPGCRSPPAVVIAAGHQRKLQAVGEMDDPRSHDACLIEATRRTVDELDRAHARRTRPTRRNKLVQFAGQRLDDDRLAVADETRERDRLLVDVTKIWRREAFIEAIRAEDVHVLAAPAGLE